MKMIEIDGGKIKLSPRRLVKILKRYIAIEDKQHAYWRSSKYDRDNHIEAWDEEDHWQTTLDMIDERFWQTLSRFISNKEMPKSTNRTIHYYTPDYRINPEEWVDRWINKSEQNPTRNN